MATKSNYLLCSGDACPLKMTCWRYQEWLNSEDDEAPEMEPDYHDGECWAYDQKDFIGN